MTTMTIDAAQLNLRHILAQLQPGEEVALTDNGLPVAKLVRVQPKPTLRPPPGLCKGMISYIAPDFDAPLEDLKEYME